MTGRVIVLGSVNVDLIARTAALPKAGETVSGSSFTQSHGGKGANQAVAAARAGAAVMLCAAVGTDGFGDAALSALEADDVDTGLVSRVEDPTGVALVTVEESGENQIVVVAGANLRAVGRGVSWRPGDVASAVLEVPIAAVEEFFAEARAAGAMTVLNAAPATSRASRLLSLCDVVCVNEAELESLGGSVAGAALVVTLGPAGVRVVDGEGELSVVGHTVEVIDTVGAGDATCGVLAAGLAAGSPLRDAVVRANAAGALAVRARGARTSPTAAELDEFLGSA
ncbi:MAG TPA: ribokinase [Acidimicrobiia bacterium]|nr:ribokinase [Acidimicrobiia bacterium]